MHLTYKDKLKLVAYTKQVAHGKYRTDVFPEVGLLDVVGNDRRQAWQSLGDMSPSIWTRKDPQELKASLKNEKDCILKVGSGETVTVRVPTHEDGSCLFWEFTTDNYDIGFGIYFEWTVAPSNTVSVHISDSSDEEELDEEEDANKTDPEVGMPSNPKPNRPPTDEILPVYRRDSHEEIFCGSHSYPGRGVYLLNLPPAVSCQFASLICLPHFLLPTHFLSCLSAPLSFTLKSNEQ
ncbi:ACBD3 [Acanthosepion pharaonis]|uniref:ACBD3 n=1 Tax=Acanthosepion pharaonis TaxID=158019 RepID=A0A812AV03_ACAPH|nr:ACBD3 [Sepia pharaonis]